MILSGAAFLAIGVGLWTALLFVDVMRYFFVVSAAGKGHPVSPGIIHDVILQAFPLTFAISVWIVARQKWCTSRIWLYPVSYALFIGSYALIFNRGKPVPEQWLMELLMLLLPIPLTALTAILAGRKRHHHEFGPTSGSSVFLTRGTPLAGQESRRGSKSAEP